MSCLKFLISLSIPFLKCVSNFVQRVYQIKMWTLNRAIGRGGRLTYQTKSSKFIKKHQILLRTNRKKRTIFNVLNFFTEKTPKNEVKEYVDETIMRVNMEQVVANCKA